MDRILTLLHPFMPFITEELWGRLVEHGEPRTSMLIEAQWPDFSKWPKDEAACAEMNWLIALISGVRSVRAEFNVPPSAKFPATFINVDEEQRRGLTANTKIISTMARLSDIKFSDKMEPGSIQFTTSSLTASLKLSGVIDFDKERARLERDLQRCESEIVRFDAKLANKSFVSRAPEEVIEEQKEKRAEAIAMKKRLSEALARLSG